MIVPHNCGIALTTTFAGISGSVLVIVAAALVTIENIGTPSQIRKELEDVPDISSRSSTRAKLTA